MRTVTVPPYAPFWSNELRERAKAALMSVKDLRTSDSAEHPAAAAALQAATGRACGDCTLCCKLIAVKELAKDQGHWCQHCDPKAGCRIYDKRPTECRVFLCAWAAGEGPPEMQPNLTRCVFDYDATIRGGDQMKRVMRVHVDPHFPDAWRHGVVADHIRLHHEIGTTIIVLIQNKERPCPAFGIPAAGEGPAVILDPATDKPWCHVRIENLP